MEHQDRAYIVSTGIVYHVSRDCKSIRDAEVSDIPRKDAELYFGRHPCYRCWTPAK